MKRAFSALLAGAFVAIGVSQVVAERAPSPSHELNTLLMHATFRIIGPSKSEEGKTTFGTVFVMALPKKDNPSQGSIIIVTAAHVLKDIKGDTATLAVRKPNADATYTPFDAKIAIRKNDVPLYVTHPTADVAVMYANLPDEVPITGVTPEVLADDKRLEGIDMHPGDEIEVLGFPLASMLPGAFPILRSARLASYPLTPMKSVREYYLDLFLYAGNSGGPAYFTFMHRIYKGGIHLGIEQGILGLVIQEGHSVLPEVADKPLNLGVIVPAGFIRETIDLLTSDTTGTLKPYD